jgi:hypothetical protein
MESNSNPTPEPTFEQDVGALRAALTQSPRVRALPVTHNGKTFVVRQMNARIAKAIDAKKDPFDRMVATAIECCYAATPAGEESVEVRLMQPVLDADSVPRKDAHGQPVLKPVMGEDGQPKVESRTRMMFRLGQRILNAKDAEALLEEGTDKSSLLGKVSAALLELSRFDEAVVDAKN